MNIQTVAVVTDLLSREDCAVQRACRIAGNLRARLKLVYVPAPHRPQADATRSLVEAAARIRASERLLVEHVAVQDRSTDAVVSAVAGCDLLVLQHQPERTLQALVAGPLAQRLLRRLDVPVLVVRSAPDQDYGRILVAVDVRPECLKVVAAAAALDPDAELELFHATSTRKEAWLRSAEASEQAVRAFRRAATRHARQKLLHLSDSFSARRNRVETTIGRGDPARQALIQQERTGARLVAVGKQRRAAWADLLFGSAAQRILGWGRSDVLVVPHVVESARRPAHAGGQAAAVGPWGSLVGVPAPRGEDGHVR